MGVIGGLVEEEVLDHDAFHRRQARRDMMGVGSDWSISSPLNEQRLDVPSVAASSILGMRKPGSLSSGTPSTLEQFSRRRVGDVR